MKQQPAPEADQKLRRTMHEKRAQRCVPFSVRLREVGFLRTPGVGHFNQLRRLSRQRHTHGSIRPLGSGGQSFHGGAARVILRWPQPPRFLAPCTLACGPVCDGAGMRWSRVDIGVRIEQHPNEIGHRHGKDPGARIARGSWECCNALAARVLGDDTAFGSASGLAMPPIIVFIY